MCADISGLARDESHLVEPEGRYDNGESRSVPDAWLYVRKCPSGVPPPCAQGALRADARFAVVFRAVVWRPGAFLVDAFIIRVQANCRPS